MKQLFSVTFCTLALCLGANAATIGLYTFTSSSLASSDTDPNSIASSVTAGSAFTSAAAANTTYGNPTPSLAVDSTLTTATTQAAAVTANQYFSFTLTPNAGVPLNLSTLAFDYANYSTDGTYPTENFFVRTNVDNFAANTAAAVASTAASAGAFATATVSLNGAAFQNLTTPIEFRIYIYDNTTQTTRGAVVDNITLTNVPEPATHALLMVGLCFVFVVRCRRKVRAQPANSIQLPIEGGNVDRCYTGLRILRSPRYTANATVNPRNHA